MKKSKARFAPGTPVKFLVWEGSVIPRKGVVVEDGKPWVVVRTGIFLIKVRRSALTVSEGGK